MKEKLHHLLHSELEFEKFKNHYNEVAQSEILKNVVEKKKSNYYYEVTENKKDINVNLTTLTAPNNKFKPEYHGNPHDHIHPQHWLKNPDQADQNKWSYMAYWEIYLDQYMRKVRPGNVDDELFKYVRAQNVPSYAIQNNLKNNLYYDYLFSFDNEFYKKFSEDIKRMTKPHDHEDKDRPVGKHWKYDHKFPHVADRIGWTSLQEHPIDKNFIYERVESHPLYQHQPFVQAPSYEPNRDVIIINLA
jgi:hypothetical protein